MMRIFLLFYGALILYGCSTGAYDRESELVEYLLHEHNHSELSDAHIILLLNRVCTSCSAGTIQKLLSLVDRGKSNTIIILSSEDEVIRKNLESNKYVTIYTDKNFAIEKYGLSQVTNIYFKFKRNKIAFWTPIQDETLHKIMRQYE